MKTGMIGDGMLKIFMVVGVLALVTVVGGCSMPISVVYTPVAATETLVEDGVKPRIYVGKFEDVRENKQSVGALKNSFGGEVKKLVTSDDLELLFAEASTDALRKGGAEASLHSDRKATTTIPADELKDADYVLGGRLKTVNVESNPGWSTVRITAKVVIDVYVYRRGKGEWIGPIEGTAEMRDFQYPQVSSLSGTLDKAIGNCMRNMVRHLKASGAFTAAKN
jgi:hypothetical protein